MSEAAERQKWTPEQDQLLSAAVAKVSLASGSINWNHVAAHVPGRTNKNCRKRWHYKVAHNFTMGPWKPEEDERLQLAVQMYGTKWSKVSQHVGTRNGDQCWKRWHDSLDPNIDHSPWTSEEDILLMQEVEKTGTNWREIVNRHFPNRNALGAKNRHALLQRRIDNGQPLSGPKKSKASRKKSSQQGKTATGSVSDASTVSLKSDPELYLLGSLGVHDLPMDIGTNGGGTAQSTDMQWDQCYFDFNMTENVHTDEAAFLMSSDVGYDSSCHMISLSSGPTADASSEESESALGNWCQASSKLSPNEDAAMYGPVVYSSSQDTLTETQKTLQVRVSCHPHRLENVMRNLSRGVNDMVLSGDISTVQYVVD